MFDAEAPPVPAAALRSLSGARRGEGGVVGAVSGEGDLERRLLEIGVVEGARIRVLHEGLFGRDPIALQVDDTRVALRRREAAGVMFRPEPRPGARPGAPA